MSVWAASSNNTVESKLDIGGKHYDYYRPQLIVFYSCISSTHRPGSDTTVGERSNFKNFLRTRKNMVMQTRGESVIHVPS